MEPYISTQEVKTSVVDDSVRIPSLKTRVVSSYRRISHVDTFICYDCSTTRYGTKTLYSLSTTRHTASVWSSTTKMRPCLMSFSGTHMFHFTRYATRDRLSGRLCQPVTRLVSCVAGQQHRDRYLGRNPDEKGCSRQ